MLFKQVFFFSLALMVSFHTVAKQITPRIVGGTVSAQDSWPSYVALSFKDDPDNAFCGGTLIAPSWVVTAAHCTLSKEQSNLQVVIGLYAYDGEENRLANEYFDVADVIAYPAFSGSAGEEGDIALVKLDGKSNGKLSKVYAGSSQLSGNLATFVGFGDTVVQDELFSYKPHYPARRREVSLPIISHSLCHDAMSGVAPIYDSQICVGVPEGRKDACAGDSGGPVYLTRGQDSDVLVGVVSYGVGCALPSFYSVNTRVSHYVDFIKAHVPDVQLDESDYGYTLTREVSGAWYNDTRNGEGWIIEVMPNNAMAVYWFTYDLAGEPIYLYGVGEYDTNSDQAMISLFQTSGATFGDAFDTNDVQSSHWGTLTFTAKSCDQAHIAYESELPEYGSGQVDLTRLTKLNTTNCAGRFDGSERMLAGSWYDGNRSGEGLILETLPADVLGFYFFTYGFDGHPLTISGVAEKQSDGTFRGTAYAPNGPKFGKNYDKADLRVPELGQISIVPKDCGRLTFQYHFSGDYGKKIHEYTRLTQVVGNGCE